MHKRFAIFDMDGTLVDSMGYWRELGREYLQSKNIISLDINKHLYTSPEIDRVLEDIKTMTMSESAAYFLQKFPLEGTPERIADEMNEMMYEHYRKDIPLKSGVVKYLEKLQQENVTMCVASATAEPLMKDCLLRLGVADYFSFFLSCESVGVGKSQPDVFFEAARCLGGKPEEIAVYEDALYAVETAKKAGFYTIGVRDSSNEKDWAQICTIADEILV